ncbi:MAG: ABC transporter permease [Lutisporaceae bacterium]
MKRILLTNKLLLGVLCIAIGMVPLLTMLNTAQSGKAMLAKNFNRDGYRLLSVKSSGTAITYQDFKKLEGEMPEIKTMIPIAKATASLSSYKANSMVELRAVGSDYWRYSALKLLQGKFISKGQTDKTQKVIVIDDLTADKLFGTTDVLGRNLKISINGTDIEVVVIGVSKRMDVSIEKLDEKQGLAYIPITTLDYNSELYNIDEVLILVDAHIDEAKAIILHYFASKGVGEAQLDISYVNQIGIFKAFFEKNIQMLFVALILWFLAVIVGLINIMLVDIVQERKYYGLLKFYGNTEHQIRKIIIGKALYIGIAGGIFSIIVGLISSFVICRILNIPLHISIHTLSLGIIFPAVICLIASIYPALKASKIDMNKTIWQVD